MVKIKEEKILAYALKNAIEHKGKAVVGAIISGLFAEGLKKQDVKEIINDVNKIADKVNSLSLEEQKKEYEKHKKLIGHRAVRQEGELSELPNINKKTGVIMRFAPAASGQLHVGHAISNVISSLYVEKYGGKFYIRIEDTDPERVDKNAYKAIKEDCDWLFENITDYIIQSDRMNVYYKYAEKLISLGKSYVCTCDSEDFKKKIWKSQACNCRKLSVKEQLKRWNRMLDKSEKGYKQGKAVLRFKSNIKAKNPAFRDFPLARINEKEHPRQGNKYKVWPLMNLSVSVDDLEYGMTHVIRGKDHKDNSERQKMIFRALGKDKQFPWTFFIGRIKFKDLILSKRKIKAAIAEGQFEGWEDKRLATLASLRKRGYKPEAFKRLAIHRGLTSVDKVMSQKDFFEVLDKFNKD